MLFKHKYAPRWFVFASDMTVCFLSIGLAFLLRFNFDIPEKHTKDIWYVFGLVLAFRGIAFYITKTYASIVRHTGVKDALRIIISVTGSTVIISMINFIHLYLDKAFILPLSVIIIDYITTLFFLTSTKLFVKILFQEFPGLSFMEQASQD